MKVASLTVRNCFTPLNSRVADSSAELDRQRAKIAAAICAMEADAVGLIEIGNNGAAALADLLDFLLGPAACSDVFDGQLGYLDHALASRSLLTR